MITDAQKAERINYLGSSDAAAVLGLSRWKSPLAVWAEKTGQIEPEDISDKMAVRLGQKMEQVIAELFTEDTGLELEEVPETIYHPAHRYIAANLDRRVKGTKVLVEIKNVGQFSKSEWMNGNVPTEYAAQVMHQLMVTGYDYGWLVAAVGNSDLIIKKIERNEVALNTMLEREIDFWTTYVVPRTMPMQVSSSDKPVLDALFPEAEPNTVMNLSDAEAAIIESVQAMEADLRQLEGQIEQGKNRLRLALGDAESGTVGPHTVRWSNLVSTRMDVTAIKEAEPEIYKKYAKTTTTRRFLIQSKPITRRVK